MSAASDSSPIFVVGYMHSGTTLLYKLLGRNPAVFTSKGESKYFELMPMLRRRFPDLSSEVTIREVLEYIVRLLLLGFQMKDLTEGTRNGDVPNLEVSASEIEEIVALVGKSPDFGQLFRLVNEYLAKRSGKARWMEKTPTHVFHVDAILRAVPDARFVEITRDARDVLASKKTRRAAVWTSPRYTDEQRRIKHNEKAFDPLWDALSWKSAIVAGQGARAKHRDRFLQIRYEDLATAPTETLRSVCGFLGLQFSAEMLDVPGGNSAEWRPDKPRGVYTESVNRWQKTLTPAEAAIIQTVAGDELKHLGYPLEPISPIDRVKSVPLLVRSTEGLATRIARRWKMGGNSYLRQVLRDYSERLAVLVSAKR